MRILGTRVHNLSLTQALKVAEGFWAGAGQHYIITPNPEILLRANKDARYRNILNNADLSIPDGVGLLWASRILYPESPLKERISGADFIIDFLRHMQDVKAVNVLLLGGGGGAAKKAALALGAKFPAHKFHGTGDVKNKHLDFVINYIVQPDCIFVGLGAPKQEVWIRDNLSAYPSIKLAMGVGGAIDMISGKLPRAPKLLRSRGLEWLWRLALEPWRAGRIFNAVVGFPFAVYKEKKSRVIHTSH